MQNKQDISEKVFGDIQNLLEDLSKSTSYQNLLKKENLINDLFQQFSFLKIFQTIEFPEFVQPEIQSEEIIEIVEEQEEINPVQDDLQKDLISEDSEDVLTKEEIHDIFEDVPEVEEVHSFQEIEKEETVEEVDEAEEINILIDSAQNLEPLQESQFSFAMAKEEYIQGQNIEEEPKHEVADEEVVAKETTTINEDEKKKKILEFSKNITPPTQHLETTSVSEQKPKDKKFKLAHIKALKITRSLFDDEPIESEEIVEQPRKEEPADSVVENKKISENPETPKPRPEFKLDLNDRIAFSQYLFGGSQSELNETVNILNSFNDLEKAKEYLSDLYYAKNWEKVDSYAQRLWMLVENRFL